MGFLGSLLRFSCHLQRGLWAAYRLGSSVTPLFLQRVSFRFCQDSQSVRFQSDIKCFVETDQRPLCSDCFSGAGFKKHLMWIAANGVRHHVYPFLSECPAFLILFPSLNMDIRVLVLLLVPTYTLSSIPRHVKLWPTGPLPAPSRRLCRAHSSLQTRPQTYFRMAPTSPSLTTRLVRTIYTVRLSIASTSILISHCFVSRLLPRRVPPLVPPTFPLVDSVLPCADIYVLLLVGEFAAHQEQTSPCHGSFRLRIIRGEQSCGYVYLPR